MREQRDSTTQSSQGELQAAREEVKSLRRALEAATADREREVSAIQGNLATATKEVEKWRQSASKYEREIDSLQGDLQLQSKQWQKAAESQGTALHRSHTVYTLNPQKSMVELDG